MVSSKCQERAVARDLKIGNQEIAEIELPPAGPERKPIDLKEKKVSPFLTCYQRDQGG